VTLSELILSVGDEKIGIQNLDDCAIALDYSAKSGTKITFGTNQSIDLNGTVKLGMVIWLDREAVKAAIENERKNPETHSGTE